MIENPVFVVAESGHTLGEATVVKLGRHGGNIIVNDLGSDVHGEGKSTEPADETVAAVEEAGGTEMAYTGIYRDKSEANRASQLAGDWCHQSRTAIQLSVNVGA